MFGFSPGDWIFIILIFFIIAVCVSISDIFKKEK